MMSKVVLIVLVVFVPFVRDTPVLAGDGSEKGEPRAEEEQKAESTAEENKGADEKPDPNAAGDKHPPGNGEPNEVKIPIAAWIGYGSYAMSDFNRKLSGEGNETIDGGINVGLEFAPKSVKIAAFGLEFAPFPIGLEYLEASSKTTHTAGGTSTTISWELPVIGIYFWPEVRLRGQPEKLEDRTGLRWRLRPIGVGYYTLGKLMDAELDISGSPGRLEISDETVGIMTQIGIKYVSADERVEAFVEGGYRWLEFTSVLREPKDGFAPGSPSAMPEDLDYSGFIIKAGVGVRF